MIQFANKFFIDKWFSCNLNLIDALLFVKYKQFLGTETKVNKFFKQADFHTLLIDVRSDFFSNFKTTTRNEIRKSLNMGFFFKQHSDIEFSDFVAFYNDFASVMGLAIQSLNSKYKDNIFTTQASYDDGTPLVMHSYLLDEKLGRTRLLHSASNVLNQNLDRKIIGFANRFLHYKDMLFFAEQGYKTYDLGGYAYNSTDHKRQAINKFKDSFGGKLVYEPEFKSYPYFLAEKIYLHFKK